MFFVHPFPNLSFLSPHHTHRTTSRRKPEPVPITDLGEARKKFGDVKAISSDMYFGKQDESDVSAACLVILVSCSIVSCSNNRTLTTVRMEFLLLQLYATGPIPNVS